MMSVNAEQAIEAVVQLALHQQAPQTAEQLAIIIKCSTVALTHNLTRLVSAQILKQPRGPQGGYVLFRRPESLTFYDIITVIDDARDSHRLTIPSEPMATQLHDARSQLAATYRSTTIAQYIRDSAKLSSPI